MASSTSDKDGGIPAVTPSNHVGSTFVDKKIFRVVSLNVQSMNKIFDKIRTASSTGAAIPAILETRFRNPTTRYSIEGYQQPIIITRKKGGSNSGGGVGLWISDNTV